MKAFIVWNEDRTEGFITTSPCLAYEVGKSASTNCTTEDGTHSPVGEAFCKQWWTDNCTKEEIEVADYIASHEESEELKTRRQEMWRDARNGYSSDEDTAENELNLAEEENSEQPESQEPAEDKPLPGWWQKD